MTAKPTTSPAGLSVTPAIVQLDLATDKPAAEVTYTNHTDQEIQLTFSASDFTELEDGYKLSFLTEKNPQNYQYRLSSWISFNQSSLVLKAGQSGTITVLVNAQELTPGAHYGTILAKVEQGTGSDTIQLQAVLSSLLFVRTHTGQEKDLATIQSFTATENLLGIPPSFELRLNNTGETTLTPYGLVEIRDGFGRYVAKAILNENSLTTLPDSVRRYDMQVKTFGQIAIPSLYHAHLSLTYGAANTPLSSDMTFFSIGSWYFWLIPIVMIIGTIGLFGRLAKLSREKRSKKPAAEKPAPHPTAHTP